MTSELGCERPDEHAAARRPDPPPPAIVLSGVTKSFRTPHDGDRYALREVSFEVRPGAFTAVIGPSGCGKSTLLSLICGTGRPDRGTVRFDDRPVDGIGDDVGFVFQADALFPWKTVIGNVAAGPRFRGVPRGEALDEAAGWLRRVGLTGFEKHHPHQLSGGMRKRVALAQTLINRPRVLLMDEPFSGLDVQTRQIMSDELVTLWELTRPSVVFVTHDLGEAIALADKVIVLTAAPATVKEEFTIELPRPRRALEIRHDPTFVRLHERIWRSLRDEVQAAHDRGLGAT